MKLKINLAITEPNQPAYRRDKICTYEVGDKIKLNADFINIDTGEISLDNPQKSQQTLLYFLSADEEEATIVELNPGSIDRTGEITAPVSSTIQLSPQKSVSMGIDLFNYVPDDMFEEGAYKVYIEYMGNKSNTVPFRVEYLLQSKSKLLMISLDEQEQIWLREKAIDYLKDNKDGPDIILPVNNQEPPNEKASRVRSNQQKVEAYLKSHP